MAYDSDKQPSGLTALTSLDDTDTVIVGDTSDTAEVVKTISWTNLKAAIKSYYDSVASTLTNKTIDGDNNTISNLDLGNEVDWAAADDVTTRTAFASGDKMLIYEAGVGLRKIDYDDLPSGSGISNVVEDLTPQLGGSLDVNGNEITGAIDLHSSGDIIQELGDAAGTNKVIIKDSGAVEVAAIDSDGNITTSGTVDGRDIAADGTKLDGIEAGADVTDTANVTAAGALMDSEVDADIKTLSLPANTTISTFGASLVDDADAATARTTLGVDAAGTDNSTDVTLAGTPDYITISGQTITRNQIDLTTDVTGVLPEANLPDASSTAQGVVELATTAETNTGTDTTRAVTPDALADSKFGTSSLVSSIQFVIDGGGSAITTGVKGYLEIPFACTINQVTLLADQSGSIVVDIWKDTYANYPPTDADSITASAVPTISTATKSQDATLTGWTTSISAGDILGFNVDSITTCTRVTVSLKVTRT